MNRQLRHQSFFLVFLCILADSVVFCVVDSKVIEVVLKKHNKYRTMAGLEPLTWNSKLEAEASLHARLLANRSECQRLSQSIAAYKSEMGENKFKAQGLDSSEKLASAACDAWIAEKAYYEYPGNLYYHACSNCTKNKAVSNITQIMWAHTKQIGCGHFTCTSNGINLFICNYLPPGNNENQAIFTGANFEKLCSYGETWKSCNRDLTNRCKNVLKIGDERANGATSPGSDFYVATLSSIMLLLIISTNKQKSRILH